MHKEFPCMTCKCINPTDRDRIDRSIDQSKESADLLCNSVEFPCKTCNSHSVPLSTKNFTGSWSIALLLVIMQVIFCEKLPIYQNESADPQSPFYGDSGESSAEKGCFHLWRLTQQVLLLVTWEQSGVPYLDYPTTLFTGAPQVRPLCSIDNSACVCCAWTILKAIEFSRGLFKSTRVCCTLFQRPLCSSPLCSIDRSACVCCAWTILKAIGFARGLFRSTCVCCTGWAQTVECAAFIFLAMASHLLQSLRFAWWLWRLTAAW